MRTAIDAAFEMVIWLKEKIERYEKLYRYRTVKKIG